MLSKSSDPTKESTQLKKIFIEPSESYSGLSGNPESLKFSLFPKDNIFKLPSVCSPFHLFIEENECFWPDHVNVAGFYELLHVNSPFKAGSHCEAKSSVFCEKLQHLAPNNSVCLSSLEDLSFGSIEKPFNLAEELAKEKLFLNVSTGQGPSHSKPGKFHESIQFNSVSSINASEFKDSLMDPVVNFSNLELSLSGESHRLYQKFEEFTEVLSNDEVIYTVTNESWKKGQGVAELLPENDDDRSWMFFKSLEALQKAKVGKNYNEEDCFSSPDDEGPIMVGPGRSFLNGDTASKAKLSGALNINRVIKPLLPKTLTDSDDLILSTIPDSPIDFPDRSSPISKKISIIHYRSSNKHSQVHSTFTGAGFASALTIEFSSEEGKSRVFNSKENYEKSIWFGLLNSPALLVLEKVQVAWTSAGFEHMTACSVSGRTYAWGCGASGCLGHGDKGDVLGPKPVSALLNTRIAYLECGGYHTLALSEDGDVFAWGRGDVNQLGVEITALCKDEVGFVALEPVLMSGIKCAGVKVKGLACGEAHSLILDSDGKVYSFGWGDDGQLGVKESSPSLNFIKNVNIVEDLQVKIAKVSAGAIFSACLSECGKVFVWGNGEQGQLAQGPTVKSSKVPVEVIWNGQDTIIDMICGESSVLCLSDSGKVTAWGQGVAGFFNDQSLYPFGSEIVCFAPRNITNVKSVQEYMMSYKHYED
jgi:alpha-tubulin suppressor-like RCC1 family protein